MNRRTQRPAWSDYLRHARISADLTQRELAQRVGVSNASICYWEAGHAEPRRLHSALLTSVLALPAGELERLILEGAR